MVNLLAVGELTGRVSVGKGREICVTTAVSGLVRKRRKTKGNVLQALSLLRRGEVEGRGCKKGGEEGRLRQRLWTMNVRGEGKHSTPAKALKSPNLI